jgi:hypothetical protein
MVKKIPYCLFLSLFMLFIFSSSSLADETIPEPLKSWIPWVLKDSEKLSCPFINQTNYGDQDNHLCAWSGVLELKAEDDGASFTQSWQVLLNSVIPLPGDSNSWPSNITVNGTPMPILNNKGQPNIELDKGDYVLKGMFKWQKIPASLSIPKQYALVNMSINGKAIAFPKIENNELWFQESTQNQAQQDSIDVRVVRKVSDGPYVKLQSIITVNVSGKMREVILGEALPKGFKLTGIEGETSAFLDAQGLLHSKLKPGSWQIIVNAYADPQLLNWQRPEQSHHWPGEEIWVFAGNEKLRIGKLSGASVIDSGQADMPKPWYNLPAYMLASGDALSYDIQHRGKPLHLENQLSLERSLWVSFDNTVYSFKDRLTGSMIEDWRLSMPAPFMLESAEDQDGSVLITTLKADERGVENRYPQVNITARGIIQATKALPVSGWMSDFERVSITLNLPPGNKLFSVFGADSVSDSWWSRWSIWASFIVLLASLAAFRLTSVSAGIITGLMLVVIYQEASAPVMAILNLLVAIALKKHLPFERIKSLIKVYWGASIAFAVGAILLFSATQIRTMIHPQLETANSNTYAQSFGSMERVQSRVLNAPLSAQPEGKMRFEADAALETPTVSASRSKKADSFKDRYQSDALIQAGSGVPDWNWNRYQIVWSSPVAQGQTFDLIILSKTTYGLVKLVSIVLMLLWLYFLLKDSLSIAVAKFKQKSLVAVFAAFLLSPVYTPNVEASDLPNQALLDDLKARLIEAPQCAPACASINTMQVLPEGTKKLSLSMLVHANSETAIALPRSEFWQAQTLSINKKPLLGLIRQNGWVYVPVPKGISTLNISGQLAPVDNFQLQFKSKPQHIEILPTDSWEIVGKQGNTLSGNTLEFLATVSSEVSTQQTSSRYSSQALVKVTRMLSIDQLWTVETKVERIAPAVGSINVSVPLLPGEQVLTDGIVLENSQVAVTISAGAKAFRWSSTLAPSDNMTLKASPSPHIIEQWQVVVSPTWHTELIGLPMIIEPQNRLDYFTYSFYPYASEALNIVNSRPVAVKGDVLAIDGVDLNIEQGTRTSTLILKFNYRSTRGGEHVITLPTNYQLKEVKTDGRLINLQPKSGQLALPISPGTHNVQITMRGNVSEHLLFLTPEINLHAPSSNITTKINVSTQRWILWTKGPVLGPAILYWGELLAFILIALLVSRVKFSPLSTVNWLVLGFGLSLNNWGILVLIALWFSAVTASQHRPQNMPRVSFNASQALLYILSGLAIISLISVVPISLLSAPSMGIEGYQSYGNNLTWFADKADGILPTVSVLSISIWFYKAIMLMWVIWLSTSLLAWIKWAWKTMGTNGYWKSQLSEKLKQEKPQSLQE